MNANNPFEAEIVAQPGDIAQLSYLVGEGASVYVADDSLLLYAQCGAADDAITLNMPANTDGYIYRSLSIFHPLSTITPPPSSIKEIINFKLQTSKSTTSTAANVHDRVKDSISVPPMAVLHGKSS